MSPKPAFKQHTPHWLLLLVWIVVGTGLRFTLLESKPPWADEWATLVFSLGQSFRTVPLDQIITVDTLLHPLQLDGTTQPRDVIEHLMTESTHPPVYFVLTHLWLKLFSSQGLVSVWVARSLSALFGVASIPAMFGFGWYAFRSPMVGQMAAALMAVSPYGIYLAQEARHYTLGILWIIASLSCLIAAIRHLKQGASLPILVALIWIVVNSLGMATHYFFALTLMGELLVLLRYWLIDKVRRNNWSSIYAAIIGTAIGGSVWLTAWRSIPDSNLTEWIYHGQPLGSEFLEPIGRLFAWMATMLFLLPIEGTPLFLTLASSFVLLLTLLWLMPTFVGRFRQIQSTSAKILGGFTLGVLALILLITYTLGTDLTLAARYHFVYFPALLVLIGAVLSQSWSADERSPSKPPRLHFRRVRGKQVVIVTLLMGLLGGLTVMNNLAYQKPDRPELVVPVMLEAHRDSSEPVLIATAHKTHEQTGEMMGLAWELYSHRSISNFRFLLAHKQNDAQQATQTLYDTLAQIPRPFQVWLVNFSAPTNLKAQNCRPSNSKGKVPGYQYRLYDCLT